MTFPSSVVTVAVISTLCGDAPPLSYTSVKSTSSSFCGNARNATGGPGSIGLSCSSARAVGNAAPVEDVTTSPLMLNGAFA